jgi:DNA-binding MltR family transcriptional regulator
VRELYAMMGTLYCTSKRKGYVMSKKAKPPPLPEELSAQMHQLNDVLNKSGTLQCVLLGAAFVDHCLASLLRKYLVDGETSTGMLQPGRALGDYAARRQLCYCLGLITKSVSEDIERIGQVRNLFAHRLFDISFDNDEVIKLCNGFRASGVIEHVHKVHGTTHPRSRFVIAVNLAASWLLLEALPMKHRKRKGE